MVTVSSCQKGVVNDAVGPHPQYEAFADEYLEHARNNLHNAQTGQRASRSWVMWRG